MGTKGPVHRLVVRDSTGGMDWHTPQCRREAYGRRPNAQQCTDGTVHGEDEFLFAPFSVFTARRVHWEDSPLVDMFTERPHIIEVDVAPDNRGQPSGLPIAPWC